MFRCFFCYSTFEGKAKNENEKLVEWERRRKVLCFLMQNVCRLRRPTCLPFVIRFVAEKEMLSRYPKFIWQTRIKSERRILMEVENRASFGSPLWWDTLYCRLKREAVAIKSINYERSRDVTQEGRNENSARVGKSFNIDFLTLAGQRRKWNLLTCLGSIYAPQSDAYGMGLDVV
jgi:hypothetical protein